MSKIRITKPLFRVDIKLSVIKEKKIYFQDKAGYNRELHQLDATRDSWAVNKEKSRVASKKMSEWLRNYRRDYRFGTNYLKKSDANKEFKSLPAFVRRNLYVSEFSYLSMSEIGF
jgi:hypothetical protein